MPLSEVSRSPELDFRLSSALEPDNALSLEPPPPSPTELSKQGVTSLCNGGLFGVPLVPFTSDNKELSVPVDDIGGPKDTAAASSVVASLEDGLIRWSETFSLSGFDNWKP